MHKLNTTQKNNQCKMQQNRTTMIQSPFTTLGQEMRLSWYKQNVLSTWQQSR